MFSLRRRNNKHKLTNSGNGTAFSGISEKEDNLASSELSDREFPFHFTFRSFRLNGSLVGNLHVTISRFSGTFPEDFHE